jgi:hypothetical protein
VALQHPTRPGDTDHLIADDHAVLALAGAGV